MGWLYSFDRDRKQTIEHLRRPERYAPNYRLIRSMPVGNHHWYLIEQLATGRKIVGLDLMQGGGRDHGWGYKDIDETMGPCEVDCPLWLIDNATAPENQYAYDWRQKVRRYHESKRAKKKALGPGCRIKYGDHEYVLERPIGRRGWYATGPHGVQYRIKCKQVAAAELVA